MQICLGFRLQHHIAEHHLEQDAFHDAQGSLKVHVVAHTFGLPAEHGSVGSKTCFKFSFCQQVDPNHLRHGVVDQHSIMSIDYTKTYLCILLHMHDDDDEDDDGPTARTHVDVGKLPTRKPLDTVADHPPVFKRAKIRLPQNLSSRAQASS